MKTAEMKEIAEEHTVAILRDSRLPTDGDRLICAALIDKAITGAYLGKIIKESLE